MIREVTLRRFKRFEDQTFRLDGHIVLAGPNNSGKTTLLQAIATWQLAWTRWTELGDSERRDDGYAWAPMARRAFFAVPLREFQSLWHHHQYEGSIEIEVATQDGWRIAMELKADSTEQIYVRPAATVEPWVLDLGTLSFAVTFVPAMTGMSLDEPVYQPAKLDQLLGMGRPGEVLRNLLIEAHASPAWKALEQSVQRLFGYELLPPDGRGAGIIALYREVPGGPAFDLSSAGSGFLQVLLLLTLLHVRRGAVLLVDEPDAHLNPTLQDAVYAELRSVAAKAQSQLIVATHSEVIINAVDPRELYLFFGKPRRLADATEHRRLNRALGVLTQTDVMLALEARGILYLGCHTDLALLQEWARILEHPTYRWLSSQPFWRPHVWEPRQGTSGIPAHRHYESLQLIREDLPGVIVLDGDERHHGESPISGQGLQRLAWSRYGAESYLVQPVTLERFVQQCAVVRGVSEVTADANATRKAWAHLFGSEEWADQFLAAPMSPPPLIEAYLKTTKARTEILPTILQATGLHGMETTRFAEIAAIMRPEEIHPEVRRILESVGTALRLD